MDRSLAQQESTVSLLSDLDHVAESTENLYTMICKALDYVENVRCIRSRNALRSICYNKADLHLCVLLDFAPVQVIDHKKEGDAAIGRALRDTIAAVPKVAQWPSCLCLSLFFF